MTQGEEVKLGPYTFVSRFTKHDRFIGVLCFAVFFLVSLGAAWSVYDSNRRIATASKSLEKHVSIDIRPMPFVGGFWSFPKSAYGENGNTKNNSSKKQLVSF